jgi:hypothetical protein
MAGKGSVLASHFSYPASSRHGSGWIDKVRHLCYQI